MPKDKIKNKLNPYEDYFKIDEAPQNKFSIENYKAFISEQSIPLKKNTLIFGHNSSGKSSIIESLTSLKESYQNSGLTTFAVRGESNLPTFKESITDGDLSKNLIISSSWLFHRISEINITNNTQSKNVKHVNPLEYFDSAKIKKYYKWHSKQVNLKKIELVPTFKNQILNSNKKDSYNKICSFNLREKIEGDEKLIDTFEIIEPNPNIKVAEIDKKSINIDHPYWDSVFNLIFDENFFPFFIFNLIVASEEEKMADTEEGKSSYWTSLRNLMTNKDLTKNQIENFEYFANKFKIKIPNIKKRRSGLLNIYDEDKGKDYLSLTQSINFFNRLKVDNPFKFGRFSSLKFNNLNKSLIKEILEKIKKNEDFREEIIDDYVVNTKSVFEGIKFKETFSESLLDQIMKFRKSVVRNYLEISDKEQKTQNTFKKLLRYTLPTLTLLRMELEESQYCRKILPLGVNRPDALSVYEYSGTTPENVGSSAQHIPDLLYRMNEDYKSEINYWLNEIGLNFDIDLKTSEDDDIFQIQVLDKNRKNQKNKKKKTFINYKYSGTGLHSILPVILNSIISKDKVLTFQEPERSMHPKYQIKMADMFLNMSIRRQNKFIIETHSEYIVYRFMRLVRENKISNEDLSFNYVIKTPEGSEIKNLRMDNKGNFIDKWPQGFFTERLSVFK